MSKIKKVVISLIFIALVIIVKNINKVEAATTYRWPIGGTNSEETYRDYRYYGSNQTGPASDGKYGREYIVDNDKWPKEKAYYAKSESHFGMDITGINGHSYEVVSVVNGKVIATSGNRVYSPSVNYADRNQRRTNGGLNDGGGYGNYIIIQETSTGRCFLYAHLKGGTIKVKKGDSVKVGTNLAKMGSSGDSGHMHLHFEIRTSKSATIEEYNNGQHVLVATNNSRTLDPEKYIGSAPVKAAKVRFISTKRNGLVENIYIFFDKEIKVNKVPKLKMTVGGKEVTATYIGKKGKIGLFYQINYKDLSGSVVIKSLDGGQIVNKDAQYCNAKLKISEKKLDSIATAAKVKSISSTRAGNCENIKIYFDKPIKVVKAPDLTILMGNKKILATYTGLTESDKCLCYKVDYNNIDLFFSGNVTIISLDGGKVVNKDAEYRRANVKIWQKKLNSLKSISISNTFEGIAKYNRGDIDSNGKITMNDVSLIYSIYRAQSTGQSLEKYTTEQIMNADVNMDGKIDIQDVWVINQCSQKMRTIKTKEKLTELLKYDVNNDKKIDKNDVQLMINATKKEYNSKYDVNNDGKVDLHDIIELTKVLQQYGSR